jgi:hypothetical protein
MASAKSMGTSSEIKEQYEKREKFGSFFISFLSKKEK